MFAISCFNFSISACVYHWHITLFLTHTRDVHVNFITWHLPWLLSWRFRDSSTSTNPWTFRSSTAATFLIFKQWSRSFSIKVIHHDISLNILIFLYFRVLLTLHLHGWFMILLLFLLHLFYHIFVHLNLCFFFRLFTLNILNQLLLVFS